MKRIKDKDVEKLVDQLVQHLPTALSKLFGRKLELVVTKDLKREAVVKMKELFVAIEKIELIKKESSDPSETLVSFFQIMDSLMHSWIPTIPRDQHFVDWYVNFYADAIKPPAQLLFLNETQFENYQRLLKDLIARIYNLGRIDKVSQFLEQVDRSDDAYVIAQAFFTRLLSYYQYLEKKKVRTTRKTIEKHIQIYGEISGHFEKHLRVILGLIEILRKDQVLVYKELRRKSLAYNEQRLRRDPDYSSLASPFNRTIRNAISHKSYVLDPLEKKVEFIDLRKSVIVSYQDFKKQVKELSSLILVLSQLRSIVLLCSYLGYKQFLDQMKKKEID